MSTYIQIPNALVPVDRECSFCMENQHQGPEAVWVAHTGGQGALHPEHLDCMRPYVSHRRALGFQHLRCLTCSFEPILITPPIGPAPSICDRLRHPCGEHTGTFFAIVAGAVIAVAAGQFLARAGNILLNFDYAILIDHPAKSRMVSCSILLGGLMRVVSPPARRGQRIFQHARIERWPRTTQQLVAALAEVGAVAGMMKVGLPLIDESIITELPPKGILFILIGLVTGIAITKFSRNVGARIAAGIPEERADRSIAGIVVRALGTTAVGAAIGMGALSTIHWLTGI